MDPKGKQMSHGSDGVLDSHGNPLPILSKSASKMKIDRLLKTPLPTFHGSTPGSPFWTGVAYNSLRSTLRFQFRTFETTGSEKVPKEGGSLCCAWHTNGLLDPTSIMTSHPKRFVVGGRHDLVTRPLLGFWARKMAVQPVVRQAELIRGGCSEEVAATINGRSLLNLSTGIAHGFGCFLFPEGTSHDESRMLRFKTGPMRTALSAAALAKGTNKPIPTIIPIGLHWRVRHHWRTDAWVEYGDPINIDADQLGSEMATKLSNGEWVEPPADAVNNLRNELQSCLIPMTPNAPDWDTYRAWHLLGHLEGASMGKRPTTWRQEVIAARAIRDRMENSLDEHRLVKAIEAASILEEHHLDGRAITDTGDIRRAHWSRLPSTTLRMILGLLMLPIFIPTCGIQVFIGKFFGDRAIDDEGLDARTTYQFLASMFGSMFFWPPIALITSIVAILNPGWPNFNLPSWVVLILLTIVLLSLFALAAYLVVTAWDALEDVKRAIRRSKLRQNTVGETVETICRDIISSTPK